MKNKLLHSLFLLLASLVLATGARAQVIKFDYYEGLIFLKVGVNDQDSLLFLMDTGANASAIDNTLADKLKLKVTQKDTVEGTAGKMIAQMVKLDKINAGKAYLNDLTVTRQDLGHMVAPRGQKVSGILGTDFLKHYTVTIDFLKHEINFLKINLDERTTMPVLHFTMDNGIPRTTVTINGAVTTDLRYDSGASLLPTNTVYINITEDIFQKLKAIDSTLKPHDYFKGTGIGGNVSLPVVGARSVKNKNGSIDAIDIEMIVQPRQGYFARKDAVGFFSNNLLEKFKRVAIDFNSGIMILGPGSL